MSEITIEKKELTVWGKTIMAMIPLMLIMGGGAAWSYFKATAPVMEKAQPQRQVAIVETLTAASKNSRAMVSAMGTVTAAREVTLKAQVSGTVTSVCDGFVPGSFVDKGEIIITLDPADYMVAKKKAQSTLDGAKAALAIEQGSQNIAREELRVLSEITAQKVTQTDLALRKPQLAQAMADVTSARADLDQAGLDLSRTKIYAPFNAMIVERSVNVGTYAGVQDSLVSLVGTDEFWIEAVVPLDEIPHIDMDIPGGCPVRVSSQAGNGTWEGRVIQITGQLSDTSRMAQVLVSVTNPLGTRNHPAPSPLMLDDYVHVEITGRSLHNVVALPRAALKDNDTVWINAGNALDIRKVSLAWKDDKNVYVQTGISQGEQVVVSDLATPVQGMALKSLDTLDQNANCPESDTALTIHTDNTNTERNDPS